MAVRGGFGLAAVVAVGWLCAISGAGLAQTASTCVLAGSVINSTTNAAIPNALISFSGISSGFRFTDSGGNFRVDGVKCGQVSISVSKPGFLPEQALTPQPNRFLMPAGLQALEPEAEEQPRAAPTPAFQVVDVQPGALPARIQLVPVSSIAGAVLDENGEPLPGVAVQSISVQTSLNGTDYVPARTSRTDDRGRYSLLDLTPGDYVVRLAGEVSSTRYFMGTILSLNNDHRGMQPIYYPNVDSLASASVMHLSPGEKANADFRQPTEPAFDINGRLSGFIPQVWTQIQLYRDGDRMPLGAAYVNTSSGQFRVIDVPRGSYTLRVAQYQGDPAQWYAAETPVTITAEPISNLTVQLSSGADIPVSVGYEAGAQPGMVSLMLQPEHTRANFRHLQVGKFPGLQRQTRDAPAEAQTPPADGTPDAPAILTNVIPDKYRLTVQMGGNLGEYVASAKLGDMEVLNKEFTVSGSAAGELHVTVRGDSATVEGQVTFQGRPAPGAMVYLIPTESGGLGLRFGFGDQQGHYQLQGVPPGDYRIKAWTGAPTPKEMLAGGGDTLTLQASEHRMLTVEAVQGANASAIRPIP